MRPTDPVHVSSDGNNAILEDVLFAIDMCDAIDVSPRRFTKSVVLHKHYDG